MCLTVTLTTPFRDIGDVSFAAWKQEAARLRSPITEFELQACMNAVNGYGALALAQSVKESQMGAGNPVGRNNPLGLMAIDGSRFLDFPTWKDAFVEYRRRVSDVTYKGGVYAPLDLSLISYIVTYVGGPGCLKSSGETCANGETWDGETGGSVGLYIVQTVDRINRYFAVEETTPVTDPTKITVNPFPVPPLYTISKDFARYGLTQAQANKIAGHRFTNRNGYKPLAIVLHIQEGTNSSSLSWWASGNADASSSVMVGRDGSVLSIIPPEHGPWTNGDVKSPSVKGQALLNRINGANPNVVTLSIEAEGYYQQEATDKQLQAICWQVAEWMIKYDLTSTNLYRHADINSVTRANCPGAYYDNVEAALKGTSVSRPTFSGLPPEMTSEDVYALFPEASPTGPITQAWLQWCINNKRWPHRVDATTPTPGSRPWTKRFRFSDGFTVYAGADGKIWSA